jgi:hypothetical protein
MQRSNTLYCKLRKMYDLAEAKANSLRSKADHHQNYGSELLATSLLLLPG